jgi:hypothetical protein
VALYSVHHVTGVNGQIVANEAAIRRILLPGHEAITNEPIHDAGEGGGSNSQCLSERARSEALTFSQDEQDPQLGQRQSEACPCFEAAGVRTDHNAAKQEEGLVEKLAFR